MGTKSRGNFRINHCVRKCENRGIKCAGCIKYNHYVKEGVAKLSRECYEAFTKPLNKKRDNHEDYPS